MGGAYRITILEIIILFLLSVLSFKILPGWIPFFRREWISLLILFGLLFPRLLKMDLSYKSFTVSLVFYSAIAFINCLLGDEVYSTNAIVIYNILMIFVPMFLSMEYIKEGKLSFIKSLLIISLIFFIIELLASLVILRINTGLIRSLYADSIAYGGIDYQFSFYKLGLLDYGMAHAIPIVIPPLFYAYKSADTRTGRNTALISLIVVSLLSYISDSTTSLLLTLLMLILGIATNTKGLQQNKSRILGLLLILLPLLFIDDIKIFFLDNMSQVLGDSSSHIDKINELKYSVTHNEASGDFEGRIDRYGISLLEFMKSPIWGTNKSLGNHAALLDQLATLGIIGFMSLVVIFSSYVKFIKKHLSGSSLVFYYEGIIAFLLMLLLKGMWIWPMFFCWSLLLPFLLYYIDHLYNKSA